ncbi:MAG: alkaline phosphatase family protein [Bacteroidota bacterium]|nr:alkaline phosphatase family protein [Bacteroidota bacterium]
MKRITLYLFFFFITFHSTAQTKSTSPVARPKLVVGIVVDQMRWDYLYRFYDIYKPNGGFKRLMGDGFSCDNTIVPYLPTVTACGHSCVYTGSVPAIHGITGNNWYDNNLQKAVYCVEDKNVQGVGSDAGEAGQMSPVNLWTTTITDELRLATNFHSKVIGISMKDRGAILPAGHAANAAFWYDGQSGNFITSTYYMQQLPEWVQQFNNRKLVDNYYEKNWNLFLDQNVYEQYCDTKENEYASKPFEKDQLGLPYNLQQYKGKDYSKIASTPFANNLLEELAQAAISSEKLGKGASTDFLAVSFSSPDYVGHAFGPNSWEQLDTYARLDETIGNLLDYLDKTVGKNEYTVFLTADHAGAHIPEFLQKHHIPGGRWDDNAIKNELNAIFEKAVNIGDLVSAVNEYNVYLNHAEFEYIKKFPTVKIDETTAKEMIKQYLLKKDQVLNVVDLKNCNTSALPQTIREMLNNAYAPQRSGDLMIIAKSGIMDAGKTGMSHGAWYNYDAHIPLLFYGWGINHGRLNRETYMTDISATIASLLHIQMPSGCVGKVIGEVLQ